MPLPVCAQLGSPGERARAPGSPAAGERPGKGPGGRRHCPHEPALERSGGPASPCSLRPGLSSSPPGTPSWEKVRAPPRPSEPGCRRRPAPLRFPFTHDRPLATTRRNTAFRSNARSNLGTFWCVRESSVPGRARSQALLGSIAEAPLLLPERHSLEPAPQRKAGLVQTPQMPVSDGKVSQAENMYLPPSCRPWTGSSSQSFCSSESRRPPVNPRPGAWSPQPGFSVRRESCFLKGRGQQNSATANHSGALQAGRGLTASATRLDQSGPRRGKRGPRRGPVGRARHLPAQRAGWAREASGGGGAAAKFCMEPLGGRVPALEQPQVPTEARQPGRPESSPSLAETVKEPAGAGPDLSCEKLPPAPRPARLRPPPLSLGYGAFRRPGSAGPEPPSPGPASAERPQDGKEPGTEPAPGAWAPVELQVDVRVKPVGAAGGSRAPSPAPSTRFLTVPVPESPAFARQASPAHPLLQRAPSPGGSWGWASPAEGRAGSPGSPTCRCRCRCQELQQEEDAAPLHRAGVDGDQKLPRATALIGLPMYMKSLHWALAVMAVLLAISAVAIVALASRAGARCQPCPPGWMWAEEHCYYFSAEAQAWDASQAFCSAQGATLPLLDHTQGLLIRYAVTKDSWMGVQRGRQGWHWIDGTPLPPQLFPEDGNNPNLNCGGLEEGKLVALDCSSPRPWVCAKETE
ncbi:killer cell lectin-like receptor subfamily G member 2 [Cynocephalus volans]|uniref:killer cell lectin-like receptor subfamily G member 2 n=1 Tax=Cynocephalus volans TaxID=110931 RepID=UPI002FCA06AA